jgi:hypothetical protein
MRRHLLVGLMLAFLAGCQSPPEAVYLVTITDVNGNQKTSTLELTSDLDRFQKSLEQVIETQVMTFSGPRSPSIRLSTSYVTPAGWTVSWPGNEYWVESAGVQHRLMIRHGDEKPREIVTGSGVYALEITGRHLVETFLRDVARHRESREFDMAASRSSANP